MMTTTKTKFKQTEIGMIPEDWEVKKLKEVNVQIFSGGTPDTRRQEYWNGSLPWFSSGETRQTFIRDTERKITRAGVENSSTRLAKKHDVVVAGAGQGHTRGQPSFCLIDTYINQSIVALRANEKHLVPLFLFYNLLSRYHELRQLSDAHSSRGSLTTKLLAGLTIKLPPRAEQQAISRILSDLDFKIELNQQMDETLEAIGKAIFKHWFIDFEFPNEEGRPYKSSGGEMVYNEELGKEIPKGWKSVRISDICSTQYGYTASATAERIGPRFLRITDMNEEAWIDWSTVPYCRISQNRLESYVLRKGDIVVSRTGASFGRAAIVEEDVDAVFASYLVRLKTQSLSLAYYLFYLLRSPSYLEYARAAAGGSAQPQFNAKMITATIILLPAPQILEKFHLAILPLREKIKLDLHESDRLARIRDSLLPKLMSGKIRVLVEAR